MIHEDTFKNIEFNGAKGLVFIGDKILVYRRDSTTTKSPGCIDMPGGGREGSESPFDTFRREVMEEFGIEITKEDVAYSCPFQSYDDPTKISFFIATKPLKYKVEDVHFGNEGTEWQVMGPEDFVNRPDGIIRQQLRVKNYLEGKPIE